MLLEHALKLFSELMRAVVHKDAQRETFEHLTERQLWSEFATCIEMVVGFHLCPPLRGFHTPEQN